MAMTKSGERTKQRQRKGFWSPEEDEKLRSFILSHGHSCWTSVPIKADNEIKNYWHSHLKKRWLKSQRPQHATSISTSSESLVTCGKSNPKTLISNHVISFQTLTEKSPSQESNDNNSYPCSSGPLIPRLFFSEWFSSSDPYFDHSSDLTDSNHNQTQTIQEYVSDYQETCDVLHNEMNSNWTLNDVVFGSKWQQQ
ncbi:hypothetical protein Bca101_015021 [Brassica carinata]